jgi:hypothetical protein
MRDHREHARRAFSSVDRHVTDASAHHGALHESRVRHLRDRHVDWVGRGAHDFEAPIDAIALGADDFPSLR